MKTKDYQNIGCFSLNHQSPYEWENKDKLMHTKGISNIGNLAKVTVHEKKYNCSWPKYIIGIAKIPI